jgi:hypothetical protein
LRRFSDASFNTPFPLASFASASTNAPTSSLTLDCEAASLLGRLKNQVLDVTPSGSLLDYVVQKKHLGTEEINPTAEQEQYLRELCEVVCKSLGDLIIEGLSILSFPHPSPPPYLPTLSLPSQPI